nr:Chain B, Ras binder peptide: 225-11 (A30R) [synthetic construct]5WHB_C Chain C, Ras binder peptide: 225-11 (A30R) [synthetic construct]5WHB_E Chain E, Ras binder peptide: 225-11 (A30R) [synthetic construct]5WHB_F Chain F, Ras binder peptide: 225-11 (A30R) [synthetic construct]5WHB_H Chain H, Ras binder peptide: 225-11 (A30R) [synthetic construct]5WHB_I Chain I, Ras binder peptide: 225-11 (A30R) [synthetic construct]5WHB_K Chain K, Ras binder peptide: 225-11 (A30R) [synthetic construct]5WH
GSGGPRRPRCPGDDASIEDLHEYWARLWNYLYRVA